MSAPYEGANRYGDLATGVAPGIKYMRNSTCRGGGNPDRSSGNTLRKSRTIEISSSSFSPVFILVIMESILLRFMDDLIGSRLNSALLILVIGEGANRYGDLATGVAPGIKYMRNSTCRGGGNPDRSSGNTLRKSRTIEISSSSFSPVFILVSVDEEDVVANTNQVVEVFLLCYRM
nr:hypothetical protein [Tanacetum cinerariifolium]